MDADDRKVLDNLDALSSVPQIGGWLGRLLNGIDKLFLLFATLALLSIAATVLLQIAGRLFLPWSIAWTEELSRYLFIYMVALAAGVVIRRHRNVNVELFHNLLGSRARAAYQLLTSIVVGSFAGIVLPYAWQYAQIGAFQTSPSLGVPMLYIFFSTVVLFALVLLYSVIAALEGLAALLRKTPDRMEEGPSWK